MSIPLLNQWTFSFWCNSVYCYEYQLQSIFHRVLDIKIKNAVIKCTDDDNDTDSEEESTSEDDAIEIGRQADSISMHSQRNLVIEENQKIVCS